MSRCQVNRTLCTLFTCACSSPVVIGFHDFFAVFLHVSWLSYKILQVSVGEKNICVGCICVYFLQMSLIDTARA